jgi:hypothetical protein
MKSFFLKYKELLLVFLLAVAIYFYLNKKHNEVKEDGVITLMRFDKFKGEADGSSYYFTIFINGDSVKDRIPVPPDFKLKEGAYCFGRVKPQEPGDYPIIYTSLKVPSCIIEKPVPPSGWKDFPSCSDQ